MKQLWQPKYFKHVSYFSQAKELFVFIYQPKKGRKWANIFLSQLKVVHNVQKVSLPEGWKLIVKKEVETKYLSITTSGFPERS